MKLIVRLCVGMALASLFASPALADEGLYLRLGAGSGQVNDNELGATLFDPGYVGTAAIGYSWFFPENIADVRVELEASYRDNNVEEILTLPANGSIRGYGAMLNGYFDFRTNLPFVPYVGAGIGAMRFRYKNDGALGVFASVDDQDTAVTFQFMAGVSYNIAETLAVGLEYRYVDTEALSFDTSAGGTVGTDYIHDGAQVTLTISF